MPLNLGLACAAGITTFLSQIISWQAAFLIPGVVCILAGTAYTQVSKNVEIFKQNKNHQKQKPFNKSQLKRIFISIAIIACFGGLVFQSLTTALPKIIDASMGTSISMAGLVSTAIFILAATGQLIIGELLDRASAKTLLLCVTLAQVCFLILAPLASGWLLIIILTALISSTYLQIPINDWLTGHYASSQWRSRAYAIKYMISFSTAPAAYWLTASVYGKTGEFTWLYWVLAAGMLFSILSAWYIPVISRHSEAKSCNESLA